MYSAIDLSPATVRGSIRPNKAVKRTRINAVRLPLR